MAKSLSFLGKHQKQRAKSGQDIFSQERPSIHILIFFLQNMGLGTKVNQDHCSGALVNQLPFVTISSFIPQGSQEKEEGRTRSSLGNIAERKASLVHLGVHCHQHQLFTQVFNCSLSSASASAFNRFHPSHHCDHTSPASKMDVSGSHISTLMSASTQVILKIDKQKILKSYSQNVVRSFAPPSVFYPILHSCVVLMYPTSTQLCCVDC